MLLPSTRGCRRGLPPDAEAMAASTRRRRCLPRATSAWRAYAPEEEERDLAVDSAHYRWRSGSTAVVQHAPHPISMDGGDSSTSTVPLDLTSFIMSGNNLDLPSVKRVQQSPFKMVA